MRNGVAIQVLLLFGEAVVNFGRVFVGRRRCSASRRPIDEDLDYGGGEHCPLTSREQRPIHVPPWALAGAEVGCRNAGEDTEDAADCSATSSP